MSDHVQVKTIVPDADNNYKSLNHIYDNSLTHNITNDDCGFMFVKNILFSACSTGVFRCPEDDKPVDYAQVRILFLFTF